MPEPSEWAERIEADRRLAEAAGWTLAYELPLRWVIRNSFLRLMKGWMDREIAITLWLKEAIA